MASNVCFMGFLLGGVMSQIYGLHQMLQVQSINAIVVSEVDFPRVSTYAKLFRSVMCMGQMTLPLKINKED